MLGVDASGEAVRSFVEEDDDVVQHHVLVRDAERMNDRLAPVVGLAQPEAVLRYREHARRTVQAAGFELLEFQQERSEEHTSELPALMRPSYAGLWLQNKNRFTN